MNKRKLILFIFLITCLHCNLFSQNKAIIDSVKQIIKKAQIDTSYVNAFLLWGDEIYLGNPDSGFIVWNKARQTAEFLLKKNNNIIATKKLKKYLATATNNIGYIYDLKGNIDSAILCYNKSIVIQNEIGDKEALATTINNIGNIYYSTGKVNKALESFLESLKIQKEINHLTGIALSLNNIGFVNNSLGNVSAAIDYYKQSIQIYQKIADSSDASIAIDGKNGLAMLYTNLGNIYYNQGDIFQALEYLNKSLLLYEKLNNKSGIEASLNNIGALYENQGDLKKGLEYYKKSYKVSEEIDKKQAMAITLSNIGLNYSMQGNFQQAYENFMKSIQIFEKLNDKDGLASTYQNLGDIYEKKADEIKVAGVSLGKDSLLGKAKEYYLRSLAFNKEIEKKSGIAKALNKLGWVCFKQNRIFEMKKYVSEGYRISKEIGYPEVIENAASLMKELSLVQNNFKQAFEFYQEEILMRDSIQNEKNYKVIQKQQAKYEYEKQATADSINHSKEIEIKDLQIAKKEQEKKKQRVVIFSFIGGFILILLFSIVIFRMFLQKKKANIIIAAKNESLQIAYTEISTQKEEIISQRDEIEAQRDKLSEQNIVLEEQKKEITDSINYAKRIQQAVIPSFESIISFQKAEFRTTINGNQFFVSDYFIFFQPKDIVSGDFYWATQINEYLIFTVADCTGHGIPGAFMSMLGISFLNEIVRKKEITKASDVLNELRTSVIDALKQKGASGEQKDGMDIALCAINIGTFEMQFAGANNPCWIIDSHPSSVVSPLIELKPDKQPIGIHTNMQPFTNQIYQMQKGDTIYLMSDGYEDQFGGPNRKKFLSKHLKTLLIENSQQLMAEQKQILETTINEWKGDLEQIDDITVLGIKI